MNLSPEELKEVLTIFKAEAEDQIMILNNGLLELEKNPGNQDNVEEIFRTAHSIKGSSRMLGLIPIEQVAHELEDVLGLVKNGKLSVDNIDVMYSAVDKIDEVLTKLSESDNPDLSSVDVSEIVQNLKAILSGEAPSAAPVGDNKEAEPEPDVKVSEIVDADPEAAEELDSSFFEEQPEPEPKKTEAEIINENIHEKADAALEESLKDVVEKEAEVKTDKKDEEERTGAKQTKDEIIRISTNHIDSIMNAVGDLVTTKVKSDQQFYRILDSQAQISKVYHGFEDYHHLVTALERIYAKATETVNLSGFTEIELRAMLKLLLQSAELISNLNKEYNDITKTFANDLIKTKNLIDDIQLKVRDTRLLPLNTMLDLMPRMVRDISKTKNKKVEMKVIGGDTKLDKQILEELKDPFIHIIRNCIDHGIESPDERVVSGKSALGTITFRAQYEGNSVLIEISDDGAGLSRKKIIAKAIEKGIISDDELEQLSDKDIYNLIFIPGFSTSSIITDISGRGVGMDVVRKNVERLKGVISVQSEKDNGTTFKIRLPLTLATIQVLIVESMEETYTIPVISIDRLVQIKVEEIDTINEKEFINVNGQLVLIVKLSDILESPKRFKFNDKEMDLIADSEEKERKIPVVICSSAEKKVGIIVDTLIDEQEVVIKELGDQFKRVQNVMGATILGSGELAVMLDPADLVKSAHKDITKFRTIKKQEVHEVVQKILVVDDSITTRTLEKNILEQAGFDVTIAVDGREAWETLNKDSNFDIVVSDVEMPYMTGFELVGKIKSSEKYRDIPCILCTSLESEEDKRKGVESGANAYITKGSFNQRNLLDTIERLI